MIDIEEEHIFDLSLPLDELLRNIDLARNSVSSLNGLVVLTQHPNPKIRAASVTSIIWVVSKVNDRIRCISMTDPDISVRKAASIQ